MINDSDFYKDLAITTNKLLKDTSKLLKEVEEMKPKIKKIEENLDNAHNLIKEMDNL